MGDVRLAKTPSRWARYLTTGFELLRISRDVYAIVRT